MAPTSETLAAVQALIARGAVRISNHGYDELAEDAIFAHEVLSGVADATVVEDYPDDARGPSILVLQRAADGSPVHVLWAIAAGTRSPAVMVTAYRPDPARWFADYTRRKR